MKKQHHNETTAKPGYSEVEQKGIAIQGYEGCFHQEAARQFFHKSIPVICCATFREVVKVADIVTVHLATLPVTVGFINKERINQMKDGVIFINTARGELVVEKDLFEALEIGKISAAGLDVFENLSHINETALMSLKASK